MTTPVELAAKLRELRDKATPGEWTVRDTDDGHEICLGDEARHGSSWSSESLIRYDHDCFDGEQAERAATNADLIAWCANNAHALAAALDSQREEIERLRKAMQRALKLIDMDDYEMLDAASNELHTALAPQVEHE